MVKSGQEFNFALGTNSQPDSEIALAKEKAVGGQRKRCSKGKSCSATCIQGIKACLVELPETLSSSLSKARERIIQKVKQVKERLNPPSQPPVKSKPPESSQEGNKGGDFSIIYNNALNRFKGLVRKLVLNVKAKNLETPSETPVQRTRPSITMTVHKHGDLPADKVRKAKLENSKLLDRLKKLGPDGTISTDGSEKADKVKWNAIERSGSRVLGQGGFGSFLKVSTKKLLGYSDGMPEEVGVKTGVIGRNEPFLIRKLGEAGLGPRLIAAKLVKAPHSNMDNGTTHKGVLAMEIVPGTPLYKAPQKINGLDKSDIFWESMGKLHRMGIAHNDAKGDNFLIDDRGTGRFVDLGLAQRNWKAALAEALGGWTGANYVSSEEIKPRLNTTFRKNYNSVKEEMRKDGFSDAEIRKIATFGIQKSDKEYKEGPWKQMDSRMARKYINMYYDGIGQ